MATGNDMMMEAVKLVDGIVGELRGFDETPPPKNVWLDIADRLEKAFHEFVGTAASGSRCLDKDFHDVFKRLKNVLWRETMFMDLQTYYAEDGVYVMRCKHGEPNEHYCIIKAGSLDEAISRAVFDLHKPSERVCRIGKIRNVLSRVHDWLGVLIRESCPSDRCSQCIGASDLADDVYDALHSKVFNCDRFNDALDAQIEFLNEVWLISVDRESMLERDKFENWTPEMKSRYAEWLMEMKDAKEGGDKCGPTEQKN